MDPEQSPILRHFTFDHLSVQFHALSKLFTDLAWKLENELPAGPEKSVALRKLLESKDAAVRAAI